jgi:hypothetical protein
LTNDVAWFKSGGFKPQAPTLPSVPKYEARMYVGPLKVLPPALVITLNMIFSLRYTKYERIH